MRPLSLLLLLLAALPAAAADLWLEPIDFRPGAEGRVGVRARLGESVPSARAVARRADRLRDVWVRGPRELAAVAGEEGDDPLAMVPVQGSGLHAVGYRGRVGLGTLARAGFERLVREAGTRLGDPLEDATVTVLYARHAKALLYAGEGGAPGPYDRALGLDLELVPLDDPHALREEQGGLPLRVRLVWGGRAVAGAEVRARCLDPSAPEAQASARTDAAGAAVLRLPRRGGWALCATGVRPGVDLAPWEVAFTSLAFDAAPRPPAPGAPALAAVLARALERGTLRRALGVHHFTFDRRHYDEAGHEVAVEASIMTYTLSLDEARGSFRVAVDVSPQGHPHGIVFDYEVGLDGRLRRLQNQEGTWALEGVRLGLPGGARVVDPRLLLPKVVGAFAIPMLAEAGAPRAIRLVDLTPFGTLSRAMTFEEVGPGHEDHAADAVTWVTHEGRPQRTTRVRVATRGPLAGKLIEIQTRSEVDERGRVRALNDCQRLDSAEYERRWKAWFGERR
ncbi:MAG: DUF4198 domain-containing protein [Planctomycetota bacterium]